MTPVEFQSCVWAWLYRFAAYGASETSGARTPGRNKRVGGVWNSKHMTMLARDVGYDPVLKDGKVVGAAFPPLDDARETAKQLGILLHREKDHDHLEAA